MLYHRDPTTNERRALRKGDVIARYDSGSETPAGPDRWFLLDDPVFTPSDHPAHEISGGYYGPQSIRARYYRPDIGWVNAPSKGVSLTGYDIVGLGFMQITMDTDVYPDVDTTSPDLAIAIGEIDGSPVYVRDLVRIPMDGVHSPGWTSATLDIGHGPERCYLYDRDPCTVRSYPAVGGVRYLHGYLMIAPR